MCLVTSKKIKFIADKEIVVCKYLDKKDNSYITPYQGTRVVLNELFLPDENIAIFDDYFYKYKVEGGVIHSCIGRDDSHEGGSIVGIKAIIPIGSEVYVDDNLKSIASDKLYITDEKYPSQDIQETKEYIFTVVSSFAEEKNGIRIGDVYLSDKTFVRSDNIASDINSKKAIGVVSSFDENGEPIIISLKQDVLTYSKYYSIIDANDTQNGKNNIKPIVKQNIDEYPAFKFCLEYETEGTKKGDWYLGSEKEVQDMALNIVFINISILRLIDAYGNSVGVQLYSSSNYWSSTEYSSDYARLVGTLDGYVGNYLKGNYSSYVRAWLRVGA